MPEKLKVLALSSWYPNESDPQLGIFIKDQLEAIAKDHTVELHTLRPAPLSGKEEVYDHGFLHVAHKYVANQYPIKALSWYVAWMSIIQKIKKNSYDLIHLHVAYPMGIIANELKKELNIPLVVSEQWSGYRTHKEYRGWLRKRTTKKLIDNSSAIIVLSSYLKGIMQKQGLQGNYSSIPNIVKFSDSADQEISTDEIRLMHIGDHVDSDKNISGLLRAFQHVLKENPKLHLYQIGDGPDHRKLKKLAVDLGISTSVTWLGRLPNDKVLEQIRSCDFGVINSNVETFSVVTFEFLAAGKPIVISDCGGPIEYLPANFGVKVPVGDEVELSKAILKLANEFDIRPMKEVQIQVREQFSPASFRKKINEVYNSVVK